MPTDTMRRMRPLFVVVRIVGAVLIVAAMVVQIANQTAVWQRLGIQHLENIPINFFSYFTIDSNVGTVVVFVIGAVVLLRRMDDPRWFGILRACVTAYMAVTGIVYNTLLRGIEIPVNMVVPWTNEVLHVVGPLFIVADWLLAPGRLRLEWKHLWWVVSFPLVWAVYTMIRGPLAYNDVAQKRTWYPYPFLDPSTSAEGYVSVAFYVVLIAAVICGVGAAVIWVSRRRERWPLPARA
jgi:hypothetical protein